MCYKALIAAGVFIAVLSATAQANVIYEWQSTEPGPYVRATEGKLVVTNAAYRSGSIIFAVNDRNYLGGRGADVEYNDDGTRIVNSPVVSAQLSYRTTDGLDRGSGVSVSPGSRQFTTYGFPFVSEIAFNDDGTLTGSLSLYGKEDQAEASGMDYDWSVFDIGSELFTGGPCGPPECSGGSGYWQLSSRSVDVPAPPAGSLFGLSVLALFSLIGLRRSA